MLFDSGKYKTAKYVIVPRERRLVGQVKPPKALLAEFKNFKFDSLAVQKVLRWTDEERMLVEAELLLHPDFGRRFSKAKPSIWLRPQFGAKVIPDKDIYDELEAAYPGLRQHVAEVLGLETPLEEVEENCKHPIPDGEGYRDCLRVATVGSFCTQHAKAYNLDEKVEDLTKELDTYATV